MKKLMLIMGLLFLLTSCGATQEELIKAHKECRKHGMKAEIRMLGGTFCSTNGTMIN